MYITRLLRAISCAECEWSMLEHYKRFCLFAYLEWILRIKFQLSFYAGFVCSCPLSVLTHMRKRTETAGYFPVGSSSRFLLVGAVSHDLVHKISHLFCGLLLFLAGGVGVGTKRETGIVMAQHTADGFYVYTIL